MKVVFDESDNFIPILMKLHQTNVLQKFWQDHISFLFEKKKRKYTAKCAASRAKTVFFYEMIVMDGRVRLGPIRLGSMEPFFDLVEKISKSFVRLWPKPSPPVPHGRQKQYSPYFSESVAG